MNVLAVTAPEIPEVLDLQDGQYKHLAEMVGVDFDRTV